VKASGAHVWLLSGCGRYGAGCCSTTLVMTLEARLDRQAARRACPALQSRADRSGHGQRPADGDPAGFVLCLQASNGTRYSSLSTVSGGTATPRSSALAATLAAGPASAIRRSAAPGVSGSPSSGLPSPAAAVPAVTRDLTAPRDEDDRRPTAGRRRPLSAKSGTAGLSRSCRPGRNPSASREGLA